jgi:hypothetical protein
MKASLAIFTILAALAAADSLDSIALPKEGLAWEA